MTISTDQPDVSAVSSYFETLQSAICDALAEFDGQPFSTEEVPGPNGGHARPRVHSGGEIFEKGAVQFTHSFGSALPAAASERNPELGGQGFEACAISMILHPRNPYVPVFHANLRFFIVGSTTWYFGGGFDLTPCYPFDEDVLHWHQTARDACAPFGEDVYPRLKADCDAYFYLPHRKETRGVGGLFFDDWTEGGFTQSFAMARSIGDHILPAYLPILARRMAHVWGEREEAFLLYRRGRYAEFNLAIDRGTRYGLQSGRRIESVLASLPPRVNWHYNWQPDPGSPEEYLTDHYLKPQDWLSLLGPDKTTAQSKTSE